MNMRDCHSMHICKYCAYYDYYENFCLNYKDFKKLTDGEDCESFDLSQYWFDRLERIYNLEEKLKDELEYEQIDEWGEKEYVKNIVLRLSCFSYEKAYLENIEQDIMSVLNDKAFDGICMFKKRL